MHTWNHRERNGYEYLLSGSLILIKELNETHDQLNERSVTNQKWMTRAICVHVLGVLHTPAAKQSNLIVRGQQRRRKRHWRHWMKKKNAICQRSKCATNDRLLDSKHRINILFLIEVNQTASTVIWINASWQHRLHFFFCFFYRFCLCFFLHLLFISGDSVCVSLF